MYDINLDNFQGPMDLLLHLIKKNKMDILNIKLEIIIDEYLNYIKKCEIMNLNIASSYLVMAAELIEIKSKKLLPNNIEEQEEDLEENLVNRLIEYEKYKNVVGVFKNKEEERKDFKTKGPTSILEYKENTIIKSNLDSNDLINAYQELLKRIEDSKPIQTKVTKKELSVEDEIIKIKDKLSKYRIINFEDLFEIKEKSYLIVTFLAILEMASKNEIIIKQDSNFSNIICEVAE